MKKFKFRLETVERVRQLQHDLARGELLAANHHLTLAQAVVEQRVSTAENLSLPDVSMNTNTLARHRFSIESAFNAIAWAARDEQHARDSAEECRSHWIETHTRVRAVERLRDRAKTEHTCQVRVENDRLADEISTTRFRQRSHTS